MIQNTHIAILLSLIFAYVLHSLDPEQIEYYIFNLKILLFLVPYTMLVIKIYKLVAD